MSSIKDFSSRTLVRGWVSTACLGFFSLFPLALRVLTPLCYGRLVRRLTLTLASMIALAALLLGGSGLFLQWRAVNAGFDQKLIAIAGVAALQLDGDTFAQIKAPADSERSEYKAMADALKGIMEDQGLAYAYAVIRTGDGAPALVVDGSEEPEPVGGHTSRNSPWTRSMQRASLRSPALPIRSPTAG